MGGWMQNYSKSIEISSIMQNSYTYEELIKCGHSELFGPGNAQLPLPPMLMFDRISMINKTGGVYGQGEIVAELDINPDLWFFACHFEGDSVMPGCLGLDALWQMVGFYLGWLGKPGYGRALGSGKVKFGGTVTPNNKLITYRISIRRIIKRKLIVGIADGVVDVDGQEIYIAKDLRVGLFKSSKGF